MTVGTPTLSTDPLVGMICGRYVLVRKIGEGGMGVVYEARHQDLGRRAAVKTLHERYAEATDVRSRFLREGQAASRIRHPHVADVYDVGVEGSQPYLVMELLEGEDLARFLAREGQLSVQRSADLLVPVVAAVAAAHDLGVVHRDLKPENIFLSAERNAIKPKVLDFGISKVIDHESAFALTGTGAFLGTPYYVSPEQARGAKDIDVRSDQYSLGVILYECTTGHRPLEEPSLYALIQRIVHGDFPSPRERNPELQRGFEALILRAMARDPEQRFPTTRALGRALLDFATDGIRAYYAEELSSEPASWKTIHDPTSGDQPPRLAGARSEPPRLVTTLGQSAVQRDAPRGARLGLRWLGVGGLLLAAIVGIFAWRALRPGPPHAPLRVAISAAAAQVAPPPPGVAVSSHEPAPAPLTRKTLVSEPAGASAWIGGVEVGTTPVTLEVPADAALQVELRFPGYEPSKRQIAAVDADEIRVELTKRPVVKLAAPARAPVPGRPELAPR